MLRRLWSTLREPRVVTATFAVAWWVVLNVGLVAAVVPPGLIAHHLGPILTATWAWLLIIGGVLGLAGCLSGWWWVERTAIIAAGTGAAMYTTLLLTLYPPGERLIQAGWVIVVLVGLLARWHMVRGAQVDPTRGPTR